MRSATPAMDLTDPALYSTGDPHAVWRWMRQNDPVRWQPVPSRGSGYWAVTRYADVERVLKDHTVFTSERGTLRNLLGKGDAAAGKQLAATDPPRHDILRMPLQRALAARPLECSSEDIRAGLRDLLSPGAWGEPFDFVAAMAKLPLVALGPLMGLPGEDTPELIKLVAMCNAEEDPEYQVPGGEEATLRHGHRELFAYFSDLVRARIRRPGDDLISILATTPVEGEVPSIGSVISNCYSMLLGAGGTLPHVASAAIIELARDGGFETWARQPDLLDSGVEEALRWATPASNFMRYAVSPVELSGVQISSGEAVVAYLASANRDSTVFPNPDVFDVGRKPNRHLAFGVGHHYCVGSNLARLSLRLLFKEMFATFSSIQIVGEVSRVQSTFLAGIKQLSLVGASRARSGGR